MGTGTEALADVLGRSPVFSGLDAAALLDVVAAASDRLVPAGAALFREGEPASEFCVVVAGRLKLSQAGGAGDEVIVRFVGPGEAAAALALFSAAAYPVTAEAAVDSRVLAWPRERLQELVGRHAGLATNLLRLLSERLREVQERFRELATERVAQRIARALLRLVRQAGRKVETGVLIDMPLSRQDIAEMTGTTMFTVSRVLTEWESRGILRSGRERVTVTRPHALVAIAEDLPQGDAGRPGPA